MREGKERVNEKEGGEGKKKAKQKNKKKNHNKKAPVMGFYRIITKNNGTKMTKKTRRRKMECKELIKTWEMLGMHNTTLSRDQFQLKNLQRP